MSVIAALAAQYVGTLDLVDTSTMVVRVPQPPSVITQSGQLKKVVIATDLATAPSARLGLRGRQWNLALGYAPALTVQDAELGFVATQPPHEVQVLQSAVASAGWFSDVVRFSVSEAVSYGRIPYYQVLTAAAQPTTGGQVTPGQTMMPGQTPGSGPVAMPGTAMPGEMAMPGAPTGTGQTTVPGQAATAGQVANLQPQFLDYASSTTTGSVAARVGRRVTLAAFGGYSLSGGVTPVAQSLLPEGYGPLGGASFSYAPSVRDTFATSAGAQETTTLGGLCPPPQSAHCVVKVPMAQAQQLVRHQLSPVATLSLVVGAATAEVQTTAAQELVVMLIASGTLAYRLGTRRTDTLALSIGMTPSVDFRTGLPTERLQATATVSELVSRTNTIGVTAGVQQSLPYSVPGSSESTWLDPYPFTALTGAVNSRMGLDRLHTLTFGVQGSWQQQSGFGSIATVSEYATMTFGPQLLATAGVQEFSQSQAVGPGTVPPAGVSTSGYVAITVRSLPLRF